MIGMPNFRFRLPSRKWLIFLSATGSFAAAVLYDRREKRAAQRKWCDLVAHISQQPLPVNEMPRKLTIFLSAPPGDGIRPAREYFKEYIKPILVAAAMDYDVIEGRREGQVRYGTAEQIRRLRRKKGGKGENAEVSSGKEEEPEELDPEQILDAAREKLKILAEPVIRGDLVIGRQTWKEYLRGLHEGWLGPLDEPTVPPEETESTPSSENAASPSASPDSQSNPPAEAPSEPAEAQKKKATSSTPAPYIPTSAYESCPLPPSLPIHLEPSAPIPQPHILGFFNTPVRIYRFLTQRYLADSIGRDTAAIVLGLNRPYHQSSSFASTSTTELDSSPIAHWSTPEKDAATQQAAPVTTVQTSQTIWEQQSALEAEEADWHKSAKRRRADREELEERVWLDDVIMDPRIAERMRKFELAPEEEARAERIGNGKESSRAVTVQDLRSRPVVVDDS